MSARIIDGKAIAAGVRSRVREQVERLDPAQPPPGLATVLVGDDPPSHIYVANKHRACAEVGIRSIGRELPADTDQETLLELVAGLNADPEVNGILVQLPLPAHLDAAQVVDSLDPRKDVDGLTAVNAGLLALGREGLVPATPTGVMVLLDETGVELEGASAVVIGRSDLVGKPVAALLLRANATVTVCHSRTRDLAGICRGADVLVAAVGIPQLVSGDMVKPGATVIDVGMNRTDSGLVGDVEFESVMAVAGALTPVPGGVGPMTIAMLLQNTLKAAAAQASERMGTTSGAAPWN